MEKKAKKKGKQLTLLTVEESVVNTLELELKAIDEELVSKNTRLENLQKSIDELEERRERVASALGSVTVKK